jgi:hypothetical protein
MEFGTSKSAGIGSLRLTVRAYTSAMRSCRRGLLDHVIVRDERHLKRLLSEYIRYCHEDQRILGKDCEYRVMSTPRLGGLHHLYDLAT